MSHDHFTFRNTDTPTARALTPPGIIGVAGIGVKTSDVSAARIFYGRDLGFQEPFTINKPSGGVVLTCFKVNDDQYIELYPELKEKTEDRLFHITFQTVDALQLCNHFANHGMKVPGDLRPGPDGNLSFTVKDPDGHHVKFVQYLPGSVHSREVGTFLPDTRISDHIIHVGIRVKDCDAADRFYKEILGFREDWRGGWTHHRIDWISMRVPDGTDCVTYMLNIRNPSPRILGVMHHLALGVPSIERSYKILLSRGVTLNERPRIGRDNKWQLNLYDPDLTRIELLEVRPVP